jgi:hypothetical protein
MLANKNFAVINNIGMMYMMSDISMIYVFETGNKMIDTASILARNNMKIRMRLGRKMLVIHPVDREPSPETIKYNSPCTMNEIMAVQNSSKLQKFFPEVVVNDFTFKMRK